MVNNKMRKISELISVGLVVLVIGGTIGAVFFYESVRAKRRDAITLYVKTVPGVPTLQQQIPTFEPKIITVEKDKPARIWIRNYDTVWHGFYSKDLDLGPYEIKPGHNKLVEFTPTAIGEYVFECVVVCSTSPALHDAMKGIIVVR